MLDASLKLLREIESYGYKAYIVGGFVRDYIIGKSSSDVDIATNATPMQIKEMFPNSFLPNEIYGSITVMYNKIRFEITTFRKEFDYLNNRKPIKIKYIDSLIDDLKRRDFTINTLCMNSDGEILDLLNCKKDIDDKIIRSVSNSVDSFTEDALRILRAIRFATILDFKLSDAIIQSIPKTKKYLRNISYDRKKSELNKIFMSKNAKYGVNLLIELGLDNDLEINNLNDIKLSNDLLGVWASLEVSDSYPFTKAEKELINKIKLVSKLDNLDPKVLYKYGPYVNSVAGSNKGINHLDIIDKYNSLPIKTRSEIDITSDAIIAIFNKKPGRYISDVYSDIEERIILKELDNNYNIIKDYIITKYMGGNSEKASNY